MKDIEDLYFGIMLPEFNNGGKLREANLFGSMRVMNSVASWKTLSPQIKAQLIDPDPLFYLFGDTWGRCEYEWIVRPWVGDGEEEKVCVYDMYVKPNRELLLDMVDEVSVASCRRWKKKHRG